MQMTPGDSRAFFAIGYDEATETLRLHFKKSNAWYDYEGVPPALYRELMGAKSRGSFFIHNIRPYYRGIEIMPPEPG